MPTAPANPTEANLKAIAKYIIQQSYDDGCGDLTLERTDNGFTGQFSDRTDPKKILEYTLEKSGDTWELGYKALSGVEDTDDFMEVEVEPIWNEPPFEFGESEEELDPADQYTSQAIALAAPIFSEWLDTLEDHLFTGAEDLAEVRDRIDSAFGEMDSKDFAQLMQDVMLAGYGAGRYQVGVEAEAASFGMNYSSQKCLDDTEDFAEIPLNALPITDKSALSLLKRLIESVYTAGITSIKYAYVDSKDNIRCGFEDRISANKILSFDCQINSNLISYGISKTVLSEWDAPETVISFAAPATTKPRNCNPAKSFQCGNSCQKLGRNCTKNPTPAQQQATATIVQTTKKTQAKKTTVAPQVATSSPIKTNATELDNKRAALIKRVGKTQVEDAEKNVQKILNSADTNVFVRVGSADTLEKILGDRFRTSAELGVDTHQIPYLKDGYQKARNRVEGKVLGYDTSTAPQDRPIYGYLGSNNLDGDSHANVSMAYGSIALKLKSDVKDRATFTGADSFKSGIASEVKNAGSPPPPNAASLISATRHGYDREKLPSNYPSYYNDSSADAGQIRAAAKAKNIDDLVPKLAITGNAYMETQIHGGVKPTDIAEMHFSPKGISDRPNAAIALYAKDNGVDLYVNNKKLSAQELDDIITPPKKTKIKGLNDALERGDFDTLSKEVERIHNDSRTLKLASGERDRYLKQMYVDSGFDGLPKVGTPQDVTDAWRNGGTLMVRGVDADFADRTKYLKQFQTDDYFVGNGIYGNGTYVGHAGNVKNGKYTPYNAKTEKADALKAFNDVAKHDYIKQNGVTFRMALSSDANIITQSKLEKQRQAVDTKLQNWAKSQRANISTNSKKITVSDVAAYNATLTSKRTDFDSTPQIAVNKSRSRGGFDTSQSQTWSFQSSSTGQKIEVKVDAVTNGLFGNTKYSVLDDDDQIIATYDQPKGKKPNALTKSAIFEQATIQSTLSEQKLSQVPVVGASNTDPAAKKKLKDFNEKFKRIESVLGVNDRDDGPGSLGRFAVVRGYDAVALDESYEKNTFMNLLNRSKVIIQKDELPYSQGKKTGAL